VLESEGKVVINGRPSDFWARQDPEEVSRWHDASREALSEYPWGLTHEEAIAASWRPWGYGDGDQIRERLRRKQARKRKRRKARGKSTAIRRKQARKRKRRKARGKSTAIAEES